MGVVGAQGAGQRQATLASRLHEALSHSILTRSSTKELAMFTSSRSALAAAGLMLSLALPAAAHADHLLDGFLIPVPNKLVPCTGGLYGHFLWAGKISSSAGCSQATDVVSQVGAIGIIGGQRAVTVAEPTLTAWILAVLENGMLQYNTLSAPSGSRSGILTLEYGAASPLNLNLSADRAFSLLLDGDLNSSSSPRPVQLTITVKNGTTPFSKSYTLLDNRRYYFPFSDFGYMNWSDVDYVAFKFDASAVWAIDYALEGGLTSVSQIP